MKIFAFLKRHPRATIFALFVGLALGIFGLVWFEPHKAFIDERVDEALPTANAATRVGSTAGAAAETDTAGMTVRPLFEGAVEPLDHGPVSGQARVLQLEDGRRFLRLEDLQVDNGPDLFVYLSSAPLDQGAADQNRFLDDFVDLGLLKGNIGSSNYEIRAGIDLERYRTVVIWCRRFEVGFAAASLAPVP
ncbi:MAG: DM13 domain-containing protein [Actinomycetota bacterium]